MNEKELKSKNTKIKKLKINSWMQILSIITKHKLTHIHKHLDIEHTGVHENVNLLIENGLITKHKIGREVMIELTDKGKKIKRIVTTLINGFNY